MAKKVKRNSSPETKTYLGLRLLFVIAWPILVALFIHSNLSLRLITALSSNNSTLLIDIILLAPVAIVIFPIAYRIGDIYNISNERRVSISTWKRSVLGFIGTGILLWVVWYLFVIVSLALDY